MGTLDIPIGFFLGIFACLITISVLLFISSAISILYLVSHGAECRYFHYLIFKIEKILYSDDPKKNGHYAIRKVKYTGIPNFLVFHGKLTQEEFTKKDSFAGILMIPFSLALLILMVYLTIRAENYYLRMFLVGVSVGFCLYCLLHIKSAIKSKSGAKTLRGYTVKKAQEFMQVGPESVELPPLSELPYEKALDTEKFMYLNLRLVKAQILNDLPVLAECAHQMEELDSNKLLKNIKAAKDAILMDYYSFREKNALKATEFYEASKDNIEEDMDCNGRRMLAYFKYYVQHDTEGARVCVEQGIKALKVDDPARTEMEKKFEENMLFYLKGVIESET